jgi:hypothetical protein
VRQASPEEARKMLGETPSLLQRPGDLELEDKPEQKPEEKKKN